MMRAEPDETWQQQGEGGRYDQGGSQLSVSGYGNNLQLQLDALIDASFDGCLFEIAVKCDV